MLVSDGRMVLSDAVPQYAFQTYQPQTGLSLIGAFSAYGEIYRHQQWVYTVVRKRALAVKRLPLKVYSHTGNGRVSADDGRLAALLRNPNPNLSGPALWEWTSSTYDIFGEAYWVKVRGADGVPVALVPMHPSNTRIRRTDTGDIEYLYAPGLLSDAATLLIFPERDVVAFRSYNPNTAFRGLSPLEPLRQSLINDDAARRASAAFWSNGGRPSGYLSHPGRLSDEALARLRQQWNDMHGGVDNFGKFAILEEGMEPKVLSLSAEDAQYIESRKLNREEVCAVYDIPPPVVHILDRATFSNIVEQMRSMYRDTMAPVLGGFESVLEHQLVPDFNDPTLYPEFLMDEVLRGDFEQRVASYTAGINAGWLSPNEVRSMENLPAVTGGELCFINSALIPLTAAAVPPASSDVVSRSLDRAAWGRLGRARTLDDVDIDGLCERYADIADVLTAIYAKAFDSGASVDVFRARLREALTPKELTP